MPRVEYSPVPTVRPEETRGGIATPPINIRVPDVKISDSIGQAFSDVGRLGFGTLSKATEAVAQSYDNLGKTLDGVGNKLFDRAQGLQQLDNETKEKKALVELDRYTTDQGLAFSQKMGEAAGPEVMKAHLDDLEKKRNELREKLPQSIQNSFDSSSIAVVASAGRRAATHAATQMKNSATGASEARINMEANGITNAESIQEATEHFDNIRKEAFDTYGPLNGMNEDQINNYVHQKTEKAFGAMLSKMSETDPTRAKQIKDANPNMFVTPGVEEQVRHTIEQNRIHQAVRGQVNRNTDDLWNDRTPGAPVKTEAERIKDAKEGLPDDIKKNPVLMDQASEQIEKGVIQAVRRQQTAAYNQRRDTFDNLTAQIYGPDGEIRDSIEKIWASNPQARDWYKQLPLTGDHSQKSIRDAIDLAVRKGERIDPFTSGQNREHIAGLASGDVDQREKLMDMNLWDPNLKDDQGRPLKLNQGDRRALIALRNKLRANPNGDPRVDRAWRWLSDQFGQEMDALGILKHSNDPNYLRARGALGDALEAYQNTHQTPADHNAVLKEIAPDLLRHSAGSWFFGMGEVRPEYEKEVPAGAAEAYTKDYKAKTGHEPSQSEIFNAYWYQQWQQHFQGQSTAKPPASGRGVPTAR